MTYTLRSNSIIVLDGVQLTEHNRQPLSVSFEQLSRSNRTVEGTMRRQFIASKRQFSTSWPDLPHRAAYTVDRKMGAKDMISFFERRMSRDMTLDISENKGQSFERYRVFVEDFDYSVTRRRGYEFWDVSLSLVEV